MNYLYDGMYVSQEITGRHNEDIAAYFRIGGTLLSRQEYRLRHWGRHFKWDKDHAHLNVGQTRYYAHDALGSVAALTDYKGKLKTRYRYDAFGVNLAGDFSKNPYGFTGKAWDAETQLYHFHFRKYDPHTGVWTSPDPLGIAGGWNLFAYVGNNPVNFIDPWGLYEGSMGGGYDDGSAGQPGGGNRGDAEAGTGRPGSGPAAGSYNGDPDSDGAGYGNYAVTNEERFSVVNEELYQVYSPNYRARARKTIYAIQRGRIYRVEPPQLPQNMKPSRFATDPLQDSYGLLGAWASTAAKMGQIGGLTARALGVAGYVASEVSDPDCAY